MNIVLIGAALIGTIASCNPDGTISTGNHYLLEENVRFEGDLVHGDRLDIIMVMDGGELIRCDHIGGKLNVNVCEDVDF